MNNFLERVKDYLHPVKIVCFNNCENSESLLISDETQIFLDTENPCLLKKGGFVVLDFGKELHGGVRILNSWAKSDIRIRFGESVAETFAELNENGACNDHATRDMQVSLPMLSDQEYGQTGFRFVRIDNIGDDDLKFAAIYAYYLRLKILPSGYFECNDERVNLVYRTAARTLYLCMQNRLWDGIKRDRLVWIGDMHPEALGIFYLYGAHPLIELGLKETAEHVSIDKWMNNIPSYSLWWLAILCDYDFYCDKWEFTKTQLDYARKLVHKVCACVTEKGYVDYGGFSQFINWETSEAPDLECANRGLVLWTLKKYLNMLARHEISSAEAQNAIARLEKNTDFDGSSKTVAAIYSLGYKATDRVREILAQGGENGYSTFMSYYISNAVKDCLGGETALKRLIDFYCGMNDRGATSYWESFAPDWLAGSGRIDELPKNNQKDLHSSFGKYCYEGFRLSLCHGWSCGPVQFLTENALGIKFLDAGGKKIKIEPDLMGLKFAKGAVPTPYGLIEVENVMTDSGIKTTYKLPDGVTLAE